MVKVTKSSMNWYVFRINMEYYHAKFDIDHIYSFWEKPNYLITDIVFKNLI